MAEAPPPMTGLCARCRKATVSITEDCANLARTFNRELKRRGEKPLGRNEVALCSTCYPGWQADRRAAAEKQEGRMYRDWDWWRTTAKEHGVERADAELPAEWHRDYSFRELKSKWTAQQAGARSGRGGSA